MWTGIICAVVARTDSLLANFTYMELIFRKAKHVLRPRNIFQASLNHDHLFYKNFLEEVES